MEKGLLLWFISVIIHTCATNLNCKQNECAIGNNFQFEGIVFVQVLVDILGNLLNGQSPVIVIDKSIYSIIDQTVIFDALSLQPLIILGIDDDNDDDGEKFRNALQSQRVQKSEQFAMILTGKFLPWLNDKSFYWEFKSIIILNVNKTLDSRDLLNSALVQRSKSIALIEQTLYGSIKKQVVGVFTSMPFNWEKGNNRSSVDKIFLGTWNNSKFNTFESLFPNRFPNFNGQVLHVSTDYDDFPLLTYKDMRVDGITIRIMEILSQRLNFSYTTTPTSPDLFWGEKINGTWNGHLGAVFRGEKHITINYFTIIYDRIQEFDFSVPYFYEGFGFALLQPPPLPAWMSLIHPFRLFTWGVIIGTICLMGPVLYLISKGPASDGYSVSLQESFLETVKGLTKQSLTRTPENNSIRIILMIWWLVSLVITISYNGNLIAYLTVPAFPFKITTLEALAKSDLRLGMVDYGEFVPEALANSKDPLLKALGEKMNLLPMNQTDMAVSWVNLVDFMLLKGDYAITETYSFLVKTVMGHAKAKSLSYFLKEQIYTGFLSFYYTKHTPWHYRFDFVIRGLVESGIIKKWYIDLKEDIDFPTEDDSTTISVSKVAKTLTFTQLQGPFLILLIGLILSSLVFAIEFNLSTVIRIYG